MTIPRKISTLVFLILITALSRPLFASGPGSATTSYSTGSGKTISITESHPAGQSLSDITIRTSGFEHDLIETLEDCDPIRDVFIADLDNNGFDEIYIITVSAGSGSYGGVIGYASNRDRSLTMIYLPEPREEDEAFTGYMGHDDFRVSGSTLTRSFPVYLPSDVNNNPTGGTRRLSYRLVAGEAAWQLEMIEQGHLHSS